jgi:hypothetical protein
MSYVLNFVVEILLILTYDLGFFTVAFPAHSGPWPCNHFSQTVGLVGRVISSSQDRYLNTGQHKHRISAHTEIDDYVEFERTIPASERAKTVHALDRAATVTGI